MLQSSTYVAVTSMTWQQVEIEGYGIDEANPDDASFVRDKGSMTFPVDTSTAQSHKCRGYSTQKVSTKNIPFFHCCNKHWRDKSAVGLVVSIKVVDMAKRYQMYRMCATRQLIDIGHPYQTLRMDSRHGFGMCVIRKTESSVSVIG